MNATLPPIESFEELLRKEVVAIGSSPRREFAESILVRPFQKMLKWEYGDDEEFLAWVFADLKQRNVVAAYCLGGYGAMGSPWGLIFLGDNHFGMDSGWYATLEDLIVDWGIER